MVVVGPWSLAYMKITSRESALREIIGRLITESLIIATMMVRLLLLFVERAIY